MICFNCGKLLNEKWQVKFIDNVGEVSFKKCCSKECCEKIIQEYTRIHKKRYEDTKNQCFQKLK